MGEFGRPSKMTPAATEAIATGIRNALPYEDCAALGGISVGTYYRWMEAGAPVADDEEHPKPDFREFRETIDGAKARLKTELLANIRKAGRDGKWQADAWILERKFPDEFARVDRAIVTGREDEPVEIVVRFAD